MKISAIAIAAAAVFCTTVAAYPADMQALQAVEERGIHIPVPKKPVPKKPAPKKPAPKKPAPKKPEPKKPAPKQPDNKPAGKPTQADSCKSKKDGVFYTKWRIISNDPMSAKNDYLGKGFVDNLRGQWQFGQIIQPCNPIDYQAIPDDQNNPHIVSFNFDTSNECGGWQIANAFKAARGDHKILYCDDSLGEAISGDVSFGLDVLQTVGSVVPKV